MPNFYIEVPGRDADGRPCATIFGPIRGDGILDAVGNIGITVWSEADWHRTQADLSASNFVHQVGWKPPVVYPR